MKAPVPGEETHFSGFSRRRFLQLAAAGTALSSGLFSCRTGLRLPRQAPPNPFVENGRPLLVVVEGEDLRAMLRAGIEALGGLDRLTRMGREALLRGNYVAGQPYPVTTDPQMIIAVAEELRQAGFRRSTLFDSHGTELIPRVRPERNLRLLGIPERVEKHGVEVVMRDFLDPDEFLFVRSPNWQVPSPVGVHRLIHEAPVIISLPVVKRHGEARFTCALKMHFGSVSMADRIVVHKNSRRPDYFDQRLVHFADTTKPQLTIVDARTLLARRGPTISGGSEVVRGVNRLVLSGDMAAIDSYCGRFMARHDPTFSTEMITDQLRHAAALGLGFPDLDRVRLVEIRA
ncbi:MAG: DUF362 domain-containing protein [Acidobacteriota bacterium]